MSRTEVVVVGAGVVGAACAYELARAGCRVVVVDSAPRPGGGATAAGMGHIVITDDSDAQFDLCRLSQRMWDTLEPELPDAVQRSACGALWVATNDEELDLVRRKADYYGARGVRAEVLDTAQLREAEPALSHALVGGLRIPDDTVLYAPAAVGWLLDQVVDRGGEVRYGANIVATDAEAAIAADGARVEADFVVVAAGDAAMTLLPDEEWSDRVRRRKGHLAITEREMPLVSHQVAELGYFRSAHDPSAASVAFNVQPRVTGQTLVGSSRQFGAADAEIEPRMLSRMLAVALEMLPSLANLRILRAWTGFRAATADNLPFIGDVPGRDGLLIASGHEGLGITTAMGTAHLVASRILGVAPKLDATAYRLDRPTAAWSTAP